MMKSYRLFLSLILTLGLTLALFWLLGAGLLPGSPVAHADTLCVNPGGSAGCYASIQDAVNAAGDADTIRVAQGTYLETVVLTKSVTLEGGWNGDFSARDWGVYPTTIDAQRASTVIRVHAGVSPTIEGFIITGGDSSDPLGWGGGIWIGESFNGVGLTTVRHNVITDNVACDGSCQGHGGGILIYNNTAIIENNTVISNVARAGGGQGGEGGGIHVGWSAGATIAGNLILSNTAVFSTTGSWDGEGGGVYLYGSENVLQDNEIRGNVAAVRGPGYGGGVHAAGDLLGNRILSNTASVTGSGYGGGVYANWVQNFEDNLVQGNVASASGDGSGGGVYAVQLQDAWRNAVVDNQATRGGGMYLGSYSRTGLRDNLIARNRATGTGPAETDGGGGITSQDNEAEIVGNEIVSNSADYTGGGMLVTGGDDYLVQDNVIQENVATFGGGLFVYTSTGAIAGNWIRSNTALTRGGGVYLFRDATVALDANRVLSNTVLGGEGGGVCIRTNRAPVTLTNHVIAHNSATLDGGGVYAFQSSAVNFFNNTLVNNDRDSGQEGIALLDNSRITMTNNVLVGHSVAVTVSSGSVVTLSHNNYWDNAVGVSGQLSDTTDMTLNPQFIDRAAGDYHLSLTSPLVDAGDDGVNVPRDFEGDPRPRGSGIDVGADEAYRTESYVSQMAGSDTAGDGSSGNPFATVTQAISETRSSGTVHVGQGHYTEVLTISRSVNLLGGYRESDWQRDASAYTATLDGQGIGSVITILGDGVFALVEGFAITGGYARNPLGFGGGVRVFDGAAATLRHNSIYGNRAENGGGGLVVAGNGLLENVIDANRLFDNVAEGVFPLSLRDVAAPLGPQQGPEPGGGLLVFEGPARVVNNFIYSNTSTVGGDGIALANGAGAVQVYHNTVADNGGATGVGIEVLGLLAEIHLYNNLIVGHVTGIGAPTGTQSSLDYDYNGFFDNDAAYAPGLSGGIHDVHGDPHFVNSASGDYHISPDSTMVERGHDLGLDNDIDGDPRPDPINTPPDLGADEVSHRVYLPLVLRNAP
jgi:hypothetical protein